MPWSKALKIGVVSSSGGHTHEILAIRKYYEKYDCFYVTEDENQIDGLNNRIYVMDKIDRHEKHFLYHFIKLVIRAGKIMKEENPDVIISTGALVSYPFCVLAKLRGKRLIYIESKARIKTASLTGRLVYPIADSFIVQWKSNLKKYSKAIYAGVDEKG